MSDRCSVSLLIVDAQQSIRSLCAAIGRGMGLVCFEAGSIDEAARRIRHDRPDLVLTDLTLGDGPVMELLTEARKHSALIQVAVMGNYGLIESAAHTMRSGASDFIVKPFRVEEFKLILDRMIQKVLLVRENAFLRSRLQEMTRSSRPCTDLAELERLTVERVFEQVNGNKELAQKLLGVSRATLYRKIKRYGIQTREQSKVEDRAFASGLGG